MIHIASTFTADVLGTNLNVLLQKFCDQRVYFHYNQIFQQTLLPDSDFNENKNGMNVILIRSIDLFNQPKESNLILNNLIDALNNFQKNMRVPLLILLTPSQTKTSEEKHYYSTLENNLKIAIEPNIHTTLVTSEDIQKLIPTPFIFDHLTEKHGHIPYTLNFYDVLSMLIARKHSLYTRKPYKVIVLDCDGTLWDGVVEEDGFDGIRINEEYRAIQEFMIGLFQAGFLLCLCSKNSEKSVVAVFQQHPHMLLDIDKHICTHRINWLPKSTNIKSLAEELNLGLESFIFIDDNSVECAEVKLSLPEVLVIDLSKIHSEKKEPIHALDYLKNIWAFDMQGKSVEDEKRTEFYKQNKLRYALLSESISYEQFLKNMEIKTIVREAASHDLDRIVQLSQRTNQFNLFPNAISDTEFSKRVMQHLAPSCLVIEVSDKYGDYGLVGVVVYDLTEDELIIRSFFLSCRILGRGIEYTVINHLAEIAEKHHENRIKLLFTLTDKNIPGIGFLQHLSGKEDLQHLDHITLLLSNIKKAAPKMIYASKKPDNTSNRTTRNSNDYMLDIARDYVKNIIDIKTMESAIKTQNVACPITIETSLLTLMIKNKLPVTDKNTAFLDLGIDSLTSILIVSAIHAQFDIDIPPFELLKPDFTFHKLTQYLVKKIKTHPQVESEMPVNVHEVPLSSMQINIWDDEKICSGTSRNHMFVAYKFSDQIDSTILTNTFRQLMARHDSLRFSFFEQNNEPVIKLNALHAIDFKINPFFSDDDDDIKHYVTQFQQEPFNLFQAPLFRVSVIKKHAEKDILLFCIHHIIHDGWSLNILMRELGDIYNAYSKQMPLPVANLSFPYINFILWHQNYITKELLDKQRVFWKKQLAHIPKLDLVYDKILDEKHEKPLNQRITFKINSNITHKLKQLSLSNQVTLYDTLISSFGLFLSHYTNQDDINFITAISGRHHPHVADIVGLFTSLVLIRMHLNNQESFSDLVQRNKKIMDQVFKNQDLPFNEIVALTGEHVNSKIHAFNQAGFIFQSYPLNPLIINESMGKRIFSDDTTELLYDVCDECRFGNFMCFAQEYKSELSCMIEYNTLVFDKQKILYMIDAFKTLLKHISDIQNIPARSIPLVSDKQYHLMFAKWSQQPQRPSSGEPSTGLLHCFSEHAIARKNRMAVIHNETHLTYGELDKITNQLARKLKKEGITQERPVGIFLEKNVTRIIAMLGILKAGGCYVPLEIDMPAYRRNTIIQDAGISVIITDHSPGLQPITEESSEIKHILITDNSIQAESASPLRVTTHPRQLVCILFTSGSTGNPKGIAIEQGGILRLVKSSNYIDIKSSDCIAQTSSFSFDAATFEIWGALLNGATLVLIDKPVLLDASLLNAAIKDKKITTLFLTTQLFHTYAYLAPHLFQNLHYVVVGGEAVLHEAIEHVFNQNNPPQCFINGYGPTENTTFSTTYSVKCREDLINPIPIGKPITGTCVYVLDHALNPCPIGAPGKLYLGGIGLARGYINQEQLNHEKFIYHFNERLYDTGDIVAWKSDGNLKYIGRQDNQIKINGYRVELDEVELQLETHHLVVQAVVLVKNRHPKQLVAYVLLELGNELRNLNMYHYLKDILPHYMLPKYYYQIDSVPLTENGKVDKKRLLKTGFDAINYIEYAPPENRLHEQLISIYAELLNISAIDIGINAEFFDLGGNSITALHLVDKVNHQFNVNINFSILYECANVRLLSEKISVLTNTPDMVSLDVEHRSTLKIIKPGNSKKTPIVFIHPIGGTGFCYLDLIKLLPDDQPCFVVQDPSIDADQIVFNDMPTMAYYYNKLLLNKFGTAKFILAGYSFGGMLSLEMASQLEREELDSNICFIIAFDTWVISDFLNIEAKEALRDSIMKKYDAIKRDLISEQIDPKPWMELHYHRLQNLGFAYTPPVINKKIILFKASQQSGEFSAMSDETNYLGAHSTQPVDVYLVSGNHDSILKYPHVKNMGRLLIQYLKDTLF